MDWLQSLARSGYFGNNAKVWAEALRNDELPSEAEIADRLLAVGDTLAVIPNDHPASDDNDVHFSAEYALTQESTGPIPCDGFQLVIWCTSEEGVVIDKTVTYAFISAPNSNGYVETYHRVAATSGALYDDNEVYDPQRIREAAYRSLVWLEEVARNNTLVLRGPAL